MNKDKFRKIKVGTHFAESKSPIVKEFTRKPKLILQGNWLADAGFSPGNIANIVVSENCIQIFAQEPKEAADYGNV